MILSGEGTSISGGTNIAIYNTHRRLQVLYGADYGLTYSSDVGKGTEVQIRIPAKKDVEIYFPNSVNLNESAGRYGVIRGDRKTLASKVLSNHPMTFTLEDLGLDAKEDLNVVVFANGETQKFELTANNA